MNRLKVIYEHMQPIVEQDTKAIFKANELHKDFKDCVMNSNITNKRKEIILNEFDEFMTLFVDMAFKREQAVKEQWETYNKYIEAVKEIRFLKES